MTRKVDSDTMTRWGAAWLRRAVCVAIAALTFAPAAGAFMPPDDPGAIAPLDGEGEVGRDSAPSDRALSGAELKAELDRVEQALGAIRTVRFDFKQEKHLAIFSDVIISHGTCLYAYPDSVRFEITDPFHSALVANGRSVAKFEQLEGRWRKLDLGSPDPILMVTDQIASWLSGRFRDESGMYDISARCGKRMIIELKPRPAELKEMIEVIEVELEAQPVRVAAVQIRQAGGDYTRLTFSGEVREIVLADELFRTSGAAPVELPPAPPDPDDENLRGDEGSIRGRYAGLTFSDRRLRSFPPREPEPCCFVPRAWHCA